MKTISSRSMLTMNNSTIVYKYITTRWW